MAESAARAFIERVGSDPALRERAATYATAEDAVEFARELGFDCTATEIRAAGAAFDAKHGKEAPGKGVELTDDQLGAVAGGMLPEWRRKTARW